MATMKECRRLPHAQYRHHLLISMIERMRKRVYRTSTKMDFYRHDWHENAKKNPFRDVSMPVFFCDRRPERRSLENARIINFFITISAVTNYFQISNLFYIQRADADLECFSLTQTWRQLTSRFLVMIAVESRRMKNCDDH